MNSIVVFLSLVAVAVGGINNVQFDEDTSGKYNLNYNTDSASRREQRSRDGRVLGSYSFVDPEGQSHTVTYVAGENQGFIATGASIPVDSNRAPLPVQETLEVLQNRAEHLALVEKERQLRPIQTLSFTEERPVRVHEVLAKLTVPEIPNLLAEDQESYYAKAALRSAYKESLERLAMAYRGL